MSEFDVISEAEDIINSAPADADYVSEFEKVLDGVSKVYGKDSNQWEQISKLGIEAPDAEKILNQVPNCNIIKNQKGQILSYNITENENVISEAEAIINSNAPADIVSLDVPATTGLETAAGEAAKKLTFKAGVKGAGHFVFGKVLPIIGAVSTGITLGKTIDSLLYKANPNFWDEHDMEYLNPDTWGEIIGNDSIGGKFFNFIFGTSPDDGKKAQAYMDEKALAYMALYLQNKGIFEPETEKVYENDDLKSLDLRYVHFPITLSPSSVIQLKTELPFNPAHPDYSNTAIYATDAEKLALFKNDDDLYLICASLHDGYRGIGTANGILTPIPTKDDKFWKDTINGKTFYDNSAVYRKYSPLYPPIGTNRLDSLKNFDSSAIAYALLYGDIKSDSGIDGIGTQENAKTPDLSGATTVDDTLSKLKEQYPDMFDKAVHQDIVQPDGSVITHTYVPVSMPEMDEDGNPVSSPSTQAQPEIDPDTATDSLLATLIGIMKQKTPPNPPDTGDGNTPGVPIQTGSASSLYAIYNPNLEQINSFGAWLWSDNFIEQIKKLFSDPMQAIIGLHKVYATPSTHGTQNIKVGYLDSGVPSKVVSNQYTDIDCGTVSLKEYFYNVFDYAPYTSVNLYLPFIDIVGLDVADVMRSSIHIVYHVDVLSGACLAEVKVIRDNFGGTLYQYAGNASVTLPISSGSYMGIVSSIAGIAGGIAGTIASGGSALPLLASSAGSLLNAHTNVEHSGGFSGNVGAMGAKIPYLIISRPQVEMANNFERYIGYPANMTTTLSSCSGYVKVVECHLEKINATDTELTEIDSILKGGVLL